MMVDFAAMGRAVLQLADAGRIVSGASTITMQVVNQYCGRGRGITYKLRQIGMEMVFQHRGGTVEVKLTGAGIVDAAA